MGPPVDEALERLRELLSQAQGQHTTLTSANERYQETIVSMMMTSSTAKKSSDESSANQNNPVVKKKEPLNVVEHQKRYVDTLASVREASATLLAAQGSYDRLALELQTKLDEREYKATEIQDSFTGFKREIAKGAVNSRTNKCIPKRFLVSAEAAEAKKDEEIERVRLKFIHLRTHLRKLEASLRSKEQLAEGLHLIDFEQLKIENQTLNEKIEERQEELHKLRKKTTETVQVLTHIKEKLAFVQVESQSLKHELATAEDLVTQRRDKLTRTKTHRDHVRVEYGQKRRAQGFANSNLLVADFEQRKDDIVELERKLEGYKSRLEFLQQKIKQYSHQQQHIRT